MSHNEYPDVFCVVVAKIQAKYKGYRTREEFKKQKEAGTSFPFRRFLKTNARRQFFSTSYWTRRNET